MEVASDNFHPATANPYRGVAKIHKKNFFIYVEFNLLEGGEDMAAKTKIRAEQLTRAKKLLHDLPKREDGKTRPEAAQFLESDFRKAFKKGYSPKELSLLLKNEGIIIPAYLIQKFLSETADAPPAQKREKTPAQTPAPARTSFIVPDLPDEEL